MCKIKRGGQITRMSDIQNLITANIFCSEQPFSIQSMATKVKVQCEGAKVPVTYEQIREIVRETTTSFLRAKYVSVHAGRYSVRFPKEVMSRKYPSCKADGMQ